MLGIMKRYERRTGKMAKINVPLICFNWDRDNLYNSNPIIEIKLYGVVYLFLVDTGSSISFLDRAIALKNPNIAGLVRKKRDRNHVINMMGGVHKADEVAYIKNVCIGTGSIYAHNFHIFDLGIDQGNKELIYHGIIGFDLLLRLGFSFNFKSFTTHYTE